MAKRRFHLLTQSFKKTGEVFTGTTPGQAAKKAATRGHKKIFIQESGGKVREYKGSVKQVVLKEDTAWAEAGSKVKQGNAKFVKVHN